MTAVGLLHPGEVGATVGAALWGRGVGVLWASAGRSAATAERAEEAGLEDVGDVGEVCRRSEIVLSICPPHAAVEVARAASGFTGVYVDANAIAPGTARTRSAAVPFVQPAYAAFSADAEPEARSMDAHDLHIGFHEAAAQVFRRTAEDS